MPANTKRNMNSTSFSSVIVIERNASISVCERSAFDIVYFSGFFDMRCISEGRFFYECIIKKCRL